MIPKIIHQTWKSNNLPIIFQKIYDYNKSTNDNFEYMLWTDDNSGLYIDEFIKKEYPKIYEIYQKIELGVQKSDIARLAILHYYGGIYIDLDILLLKNIENLFDYNLDKLYFALEPKEQSIFLWEKDNYICNAFFACSPKNILVGKMLDSIVDIYEKFGDVIFNKFNVFGSDIFKFIAASANALNLSDKYSILDRKLIYPINDIKLDTLDCSLDDLKKLKLGDYGDSFMVHLWIHSNFEGKNMLYTFNYNEKIDIHKNIYNFFKEMYPNNKSILIDNNYIQEFP
jgi:hypothetical protein